MAGFVVYTVIKGVNNTVCKVHGSISAEILVGWILWFSVFITVEVNKILNFFPLFLQDKL